MTASTPRYFLRVVAAGVALALAGYGLKRQADRVYQAAYERGYREAALAVDAKHQVRSTSCVPAAVQPDFRALRALQAASGG